MMQPMPTGAYMRWLPVDGPGTPFEVQRHHHSKAALEWLEWTSHQLGRPLRHGCNARGKRLGTLGLRVDGLCGLKKSGYEFHGCFWHGCPVCFPNHTQVRWSGDKTYDEVYANTVRRFFAKPAQRSSGGNVGMRVG